MSCIRRTWIPLSQNPILRSMPLCAKEIICLQTQWFSTSLRIIKRSIKRIKLVVYFLSISCYSIELEFTNQPITDVDMYILLLLFSPVTPTLKTIVLNHLNITDLSISMLAEAIKSKVFPFLDTIQLSNNHCSPGT